MESIGKINAYINKIKYAKKYTKGDNLNNIDPKLFFTMLKSMGLSYSDKTGGQSFCNEGDASLEKVQDNHYKISHQSGEYSVIVDPSLFHHSVLSAEHTLDIKFFS